MQLVAQLVARHTAIQLMEPRLHLPVVVLLQPSTHRDVLLSLLVANMLPAGIGIHAEVLNTIRTLVHWLHVQQQQPEIVSHLNNGLLQHVKLVLTQRLLVLVQLARQLHVSTLQRQLLRLRALMVFIFNLELVQTLVLMLQKDTTPPLLKQRPQTLIGSK
jgi:hypothetical protein